MDANDNGVNVLVDILKSRFLLMDSTYDDDYSMDSTDDDYPMVKMHDVIRDMAIWISSKGEHAFMVSHEIGLSEWPKKDSCENYSGISLTLGEAMIIPEYMNCPRLEALLVDFAGQIAEPKLPDRFFTRMTGLRLLSISCMLPSSSLNLLTQLRALHLHDGGFKMISLIGELVNLEILSLRGSDIEVLPDEIGALTKLKLLDLTECDNLKKIAPGVISRLVQLEDLRLLECPIEWGSEQKGNEGSNASLAEVFSLKNLSTLEIWIQDPQVIPQERGQLLTLTSYSIIIGKANAIFDPTYIDQKRMLVDVHKRMPCVNSMSVMFTCAEQLNLAGSGSKDIIDMLARQGFESLKKLRISKLSKAKHVANTMQQDITPTLHGGNFPVLRQLHLSYMDDLEEIFHGPPTVGSFSKLEELILNNLHSLVYPWKCRDEKLCLSNLKTINISDCENLKWVFPVSIAESLCQLETIRIWNCPNMEEVFFKDERGLEGGDITLFNLIKFPKLKQMILHKLPKLSALCKTVEVFEFPSIKRLDIQELSWNLLNKKDTFTDLEDLTMSKIGVEILYQEVPVGIFNGLHKLKIESCLNLKILFSLYVFRGLINLRYLRVKDCLILEEIVEKLEDEERALIPHLEFLELSNLPKIRCFCTCNNNTLELPSLKNIIIQDCPIMEAFALESSSTGSSSSRFFFSKEVICPNLCELVMCGLKTASVIFSHELPISGLEILEVRNCYDFKSLVAKEDDDSIPRSFISKKVTCPKLKRLVLHGLKFESFIFTQEIPIGYFDALEILEVESCHNLKILFSPRMFRGLINLQELKVRDCSILEEVIAREEIDDEESREKKIIRKSKLKMLQLSELPKLRWFSYMQSDLELPSLEILKIYDCTEMKSTFCLGGSLHMPKLVKIFGISDPEFASRFFFNKENREDEDSLNNGGLVLFPNDLSFIWQYSCKSLFLVKGLRGVFFVDGWWKVCGRFGIEKISPGITHEIIFVIMLREKLVFGEELIITLAKDEWAEDMMDKPTEQWIEIWGGEFRASSGQFKEIVFSITKKKNTTYSSWEGLILKCVYIRPKLAIV